MRITISRPVAREVLGMDKEIDVGFEYGGPAALPMAYKWRGPTATFWARIECRALGVDVEREFAGETPKRPRGRLGDAHEGYAACIPGGELIVRHYYRSGRCDPATQRATAAVLRTIIAGAQG